MDDDALTDDDVSDSPVSASSVFASRRQVLLLAVVLPAFVAVSTQLVFAAIQNKRLYSATLYPWLTFVTALLSWCVGRYLDPAWLQWIVFVWCLALLDIVTIAACLGGPVPGHIGYVLVSAQITFVTVWAVLGPWGWQWRLPMVLVALAAVVVQSGSFMNSWNAGRWNALMLLSAFVVVLLCIGLRICRFRLQNAEPASSDFVADALQANQFGMKHMMIWATAVVPILLVARGVEGYFVEALVGGGGFVAILLAICFATINLITIWAVLGEGFIAVRVAVCLVVPLAMAIGLTYYSTVLEGRFGRWNGPALIDVMVDMRRYWITWLGLAAALSAALLLFVRAGGYRLSRSTV